MTQSLEDKFTIWSASPPDSEAEKAERTIRAIRDAISSSTELKHRSTLVFVQGSYRNRVNVRRESDVDVGVLCDESFFGQYPEGASRETYGYTPASYDYKQFKDELERALVAYFGRGAVTRGKKAFDIKSASHIDADVVPFFESRHHFESGTHRTGVALRSDDGEIIYNYPERLRTGWPATPLHYENGVSKNDRTRRAFKGVVRILKCVRNEMAEKGSPVAAAVPRYLLECLAWNVSDGTFSGTTWSEVVREVLRAIWLATKTTEGCKSWTEVDGAKYLFHSSQPWTREQAQAFVLAAWGHLGFSGS